MNYYFGLIYFIQFTNAFLNFKFGDKIIISNNEISTEIKYKIPFYKKNIINEINGFYGMIGPDYSINNSNNNLFELFNKNGVIQGVFISNSTIHFVKNYVKTDKLLYEEKNGIIPINYFTLFIFNFFQHFNLLPNIFGLANTALLYFNNNLYALNERDLPYQLELNFNNKTIQTYKKIKIQIKNFLAHSKIKHDILETLDYSFIRDKIDIITFDKNFQIIKKLNFNKIYTSMVHDFISLDKHIIFIDSPLTIFYNNSINFKLNKNKKSALFIIDKIKGNKTIINIPNLFLFHYGNCYENNNLIEFYACFYDEFNFNQPNKNYGKFRKVIINKNTFDLKIESNNVFEKYSLDFPIFYKNYTILMNSINLENKELIIINNFKLYKKINFNKNINGEPSIIEINKKPYLICFTYTKNDNYLTFQGIQDNYHLSILLPFNMTFGFHSIYINKNNC
jgi:carotenoid cleavage dioxygenase-like enzyme